MQLLLLLLCILRSWYLEDTAALTASWLLLGLPHNLDMWQKLMTGNRRQVPRASRRIAIQSNPKTKTIHKTFHSHRIASQSHTTQQHRRAVAGWLRFLITITSVSAHSSTHTRHSYSAGTRTRNRLPANNCCPSPRYKCICISDCLSVFGVCA